LQIIDGLAMNEKSIKESAVVLTQMMAPQDANLAGNIHGGVIMKMIDDAAAIAAVRHAKTNVVTASIDRLSFYYPVFIGDLVTFRASINMTGNTSMEIGVRVEAENLISSVSNHIASAYLTFVVLDENGKPSKVPPIVPETEDEKRRNSEAHDRKNVRTLERIKEDEHQRTQV
jgi:uncharacterized protein (TIGR00369 family)